MATELENLVPEADVEVEGMRGPKGDKGDSYVLTEADKEEIAQKVDKIIDAETDKTLTLSGKPADAKAAGDAIDDLKADLSDLTSEAGIREIVLGDYVTNSYVDKDGTIKAYNGWNRTDYIGVSGYKYLIANISTTYAAFFDSSRAFVGQAIITKDTQFSIPDSAEYIMISQSSAVMDTLSLNGYFVGGEIAKINVTLNGIITATAEDVGKALKAKTVEDGEVTEWEFGEAGGGGDAFYELNRHQVFDWNAPGVLVDKNWYDDSNDKTISGSKTITDFIPVNTGDIYCINFSDKAKWYSSEKTFISTVSLTSKKNQFITVPANACFMRCQCQNSTKAQAYAYKFIGEYYDFSEYSQNICSPVVSDENAKQAVSECVNDGLKNRHINFDYATNNAVPMRTIEGIKPYYWNIVDNSKNKIGFGLDQSGNEYYVKEPSTTGNVLSDFCPVNPGEEYWAPNAIYGYDSDKEYVNRVTVTSYKMTIPEGIYFIRVSQLVTMASFDGYNVLRNGYGQSFGYSDKFAHSNMFPMFLTEAGKKGFKLYLDLEPWRDKNILIIGDSFSAPGAWQSEMCGNFSAVSVNHSISGGGWCTGRTKTVYQLAQEVTAMPDIIMIVLGTNDVNDSNVTLGEFVNGTSVSDYSDATWYGGLQLALTYIRNRWTGVPVYVGFTPGGGLGASDQTRLNSFIDAMKEICVRYSCVYIETRTCGMGYPLVQNDLIFRASASDGHPSSAGQSQIARYMTDLMSGYKANRSWYTPS